ncbi:MAG TPA: lysophospholipid acyltransferase family protein [Thermoanaerobaculia bacterium]|nr:lysophospholipid acyltransferase family protein [Thermoanaerobaculia bacterium]HUM30944.1 lysophospholipid acyltransferase family protein [Thermoanaerobaculia bacterium]HXK69396.1 lysophospholipid acyltransferase family protein [Thermoanaerobaculia bacterium]
MSKSQSRAKLEYALYRVITGLVCLVPLRILQWGGSMVGVLFFLVHKRRRIVLGNLSLIYPDQSPRWRSRLGMRCARHFGRILFDLIKLSRMSRERLMTLLPIEGLDHLEESLKMGKGAFVLSGHLGNWEMAAQAMALRGVNQEMVYRPLDNPYLDRELRDMRTRFGNRLIPKKGAIRGMLTALGENRVIDILIDQYVSPELGVSAPFLGHPAPTTASLAQIVLKTGAPVLPLISYPEGKGYKTEIHSPVPVEEGDDAESLTVRYNEIISEMIKNRPHTWLWFHDRWGIRKSPRNAESGEAEG